MGQLDKPITTQEELDAIISKRVKDERALRQQVEDLEGQVQQAQDQLQAAEEDRESKAQEVQGHWYRREQERAILDELRKRGHTDEARNRRILKHVDYDAIPRDEYADDGVTPLKGGMLKALSGVAEDMPELFGGGSTEFLKTAPDASRGNVAGTFLTRERIESMSPQEINQPGMRERVEAFLSNMGRGE